DQSDPFLWDVDRVVKELCTSERTWAAPPAHKLPDPALLEARIRKEEVDGEILLTYDEDFGFAELWALLGLRTAHHKRSINQAITQFRGRSLRYHEEKNKKELALDPPTPNANLDLCIKSELNHQSNGTLPVQAGPSPSSLPNGPPPEPFATSEEVPRGVLSPERSPNAEIPIPAFLPVAETSQPASEEPPTKKRRIAPVSIAPATHQVRPDFFPSEGDSFLSGTPEELLRKARQNPDRYAYLGYDILKPDQITVPPITGHLELESREFGWTRARGIPPGRRAQVAGAMKRFLLPGPFALRRASPETEEDPTLPAFGESDEDEEFDDETWLEIQNEEEERERREKRMLDRPAKEQPPSKDQIAELVEKITQDLEARWIVNKKPQHERTALKEWQNARRHPADRISKIKQARKRQDLLTSRIAKLRNEIIAQKWSSQKEVEQKVPDILEYSVFDLKYESWLIDLLNNPQQPAKPTGIPRPKREPKIVPDDSDEEILSYESEDRNDFIEDDEFDNPLVNGLDADSNHDKHPQPDHPLSVADGMSVESDYHPEHSPPLGSPSPNRALTPENSDNELPATSSQATQVKLEATPKAITTGLITRIMDDAIEIPSSPPVPASNEVLSLDDPHDVLKIKTKGPSNWQNHRDPDRLLVAALFSLPNVQQSDIFDAIRDYPWDEVWKTHIEPIIAAGTDSSPARVSFNLARLFDGYISCTAARLTKKKLKPITTARIKREIIKFEDYYNLLHQVMPHFPLPTAPRIKLVSRKLSEEPLAEDSDQDLGSDSEDSQSFETQTSSTKKRRRAPRRDEEAESLRANDVRRNQEFDERRRLLRAKLADGTVTGDNTRLIVNETKESDKQALIYVNETIGRRIKDHQIDGVRFMWNQVVVDSKVRQGCLLAHTMGLGKTMQVITLLVVIAEASRSTDPSVYSQIPENLRESKTLILCPSGLVDNWLDEILLWAPKDLLGELFKIESGTKDRAQIIRQWASEGGVLVIGYDMFSSLYFRDDDDMRQLLEDTPNIVIGDEAHQLKNPNSQRHQSTANFKSMSRIAMTGSPLTKNVMDYYAMINWVAPNYLADKAEFVERFSKPIAEGLWAESNSTQKKTARKMLHVLKATVEPKVHRKDIQVLFNELPAKKEFIITLPLTPVQSRAYEAYVKMIQDPELGEQLKGQTKIWSLVSTLTTLLAHPQVFKESLLNRNAKTKKDDNLEYPKELFEATLATVSLPAVADTSHSNKIKVLIRILEECKIIGDKVLVFSHSIPTLNYLENIMKGQNRKYKRLDGQTPISVRQEATKEFNTDPSMEVYLISTKAGGVGLNIFGANRVVIFDFKYTPADEQQAIGRAYRIGQTKPVYVYWLKVGGTFTDKLHNNAVFKTQLASRVVDKKTPTPLAQKAGDYFMMPTIPEQKDLSKKFGHDTVLDALLNTKSDGFDGIIRDVTSTETFEIEENYVLPAEDQREAELDIEMERLRSQNPLEFRRREQERQSRPGMAPYPLSTPASTQPVGGDGQATVKPIDNVTGLNRPPSTQPMNGYVTPKFGGFTVPKHGAIPKHSSPTQELSPNRTEPILAPGTFFRRNESSGTTPQNTSPGPSRRSPDDKHSELILEALSVHYESLSKANYKPLLPKEVISGIILALDEQKAHGLPRMDKLQYLQKSIRENERLAKALLAGHIQSKDLVSLDRTQIDEKSAAYQAMAQGDFERMFKDRIGNMIADQMLKERTRRVTGKPLVQKNNGLKAPKPATPPGRGSKPRPGDSASSPQVID
ncbi:hypothetical protein B0T22DRAFT_503952, partial [Podospora appendiculata]